MPKKIKASVEEALKNQPALKGKLQANAKGGIKDDAAKLLWSLLPYDALEPIVEVLMVGAKKYSPDNWRRVDRERYVDALLRHVFAFIRGEALDRDTKLTHLSHAGCCILFLIALYGDEAYRHASTVEPKENFYLAALPDSLRRSGTDWAARARERADELGGDREAALREAGKSIADEAKRQLNS